MKAGEKLPKEFIYKLFAVEEDVFLFWNGRKEDTTNIALPFHSIEHIDEPRKEKDKAQASMFETDFNASSAENFEKGKRQNNLLPEPINKIVETYQYRKEEIRYSRRVPMDEIEKNEFNLNISRYVSTSLDEEIIDLKVVNKKLVDIERKITDARNTHNQFLDELGLPPV